MLYKRKRSLNFSKLHMPTTEKGKPFISPQAKLDFLLEKVSPKGGENPEAVLFGSNGGICGGTMVKMLRL